MSTFKPGQLVRFASEANGGPVHAIASVASYGMVELHDMSGYFGPHLFVAADDVADIPPTCAPLDHNETTYSVRVSRLIAGRTVSFEFDGYGLLRELLDDIEAEADKRGWFEGAAP